MLKIRGISNAENLLAGVNRFSDCPTVGVTRMWAGRDEADLTENLRAQNQLLVTGRIPPVGCTRGWVALALFIRICSPGQIIKLRNEFF